MPRTLNKEISVQCFCHLLYFFRFFCSIKLSLSRNIILMTVCSGCCCVCYDADVQQCCVIAVKCVTELSFTTLYSENIFLWPTDDQIWTYWFHYRFRLEWFCVPNTITVNCEWAKTCFFFVNLNTSREEKKMRPRIHHRQTKCDTKQQIALASSC